MSPETRAKLFVTFCGLHGLPKPELEYRFNVVRKWRFDFAWNCVQCFDPLCRPRGVALEVEGGVWIKGRHSRGAGMVKDMEKYNEATASGWKVFRVTPQQLMTKSTLDLLRRVLT